MCWFHMVKAFEDHASFNSIPSPQKESIKQDICSLQLSQSEAVFDAAYKLFKDKWLNVNSNKIPTKKFFDYFESEWIQKHPGWYEGFAPGVPSTNNGLESTKLYSKKFADEVSIDHKLWTQSFHLSVDDRPTSYITDKKNKTTYMCSGRTDSGCAIVSSKNIEKETKNTKR